MKAERGSAGRDRGGPSRGRGQRPSEMPNARATARALPRAVTSLVRRSARRTAKPCRSRVAATRASSTGLAPKTASNSLPRHTRRSHDRGLLALRNQPLVVVRRSPPADHRYLYRLVGRPVTDTSGRAESAVMRHLVRRSTSSRSRGQGRPPCQRGGVGSAPVARGGEGLVEGGGQRVGKALLLGTEKELRHPVRFGEVAPHQANREQRQRGKPVERERGVDLAPEGQRRSAALVGVGISPAAEIDLREIRLRGADVNGARAFLRRFEALSRVGLDRLDLAAPPMADRQVGEAPHIPRDIACAPGRAPTRGSVWRWRPRCHRKTARRSRDRRAFRR